jgi:hypothetical protein
MGRSWQPVIAGLALLVGSQFVVGEPEQLVGEEAGSVRAELEPLAAALAPLGPVKAIVAAGLWNAILRGQQLGDSERVVTLAEGLLALHPELVVVRDYLAQVLIIHQASRAPDDARRRALVMRGLAILEEGIRLSDSPRLHGVLGRMLMTQSYSSPDFRNVAREYFGTLPEEVAIDELRQAERLSHDSVLLIQLLLQRARESRELSDYAMAERDLAEVEDLLREHQAVGLEVELLLEQLDQLRKDVSDDRGSKRS